MGQMSDSVTGPSSTQPEDVGDEPAEGFGKRDEKYFVKIFETTLNFLRYVGILIIETYLILFTGRVVLSEPINEHKKNCRFPTA